MRTAALSLLAFLTLPVSSAFAAGVLLPSDTASATDNAAPNLGLLPKQIQQPATKEAPAQTTTTKPAAAAAPAQSMPEAEDTEMDATSRALLDQLLSKANEPALVFKPVQSNITPGGKVAQGELTDAEKFMNKMLSAGMAPQASKPRTPAQEKLQSLVDGMKAAYQRPPVFLDDLPVQDLSGFAFPSKLSFAVNGAYLWGTKDIEKIRNALGYDAQNVPTQCQLRLDAKLVTDINTQGYRDKVLTGQSTSIGYSGRIIDVEIQPMAVCNPPRTFPQGGETIFRTGDKLTVRLPEKASCTPAANQTNSSTLTVQYGGSGKVVCKYN